jgi:hypothetical protein
MEASNVLHDDFLIDFSSACNQDRSVITFWPMSPFEQIRHKYGKHYSNNQLINCLRHVESFGIKCIVFFNKVLSLYEINHPDERYKSICRLLKGCHATIVDDSYFTIDPCAQATLIRKWKESNSLSLLSFDDYYNRTLRRFSGVDYDLYGFRPYM